MIDKDLILEHKKECEDRAGKFLPDISEVINKPENVCPVQQALEIVRKCRAEACGQSVPCRDGLWQAELLIEAISNGKAEGETTIATLKDVMSYMEVIGCDFSSGCAKLILESLNRYGDEWELHAKRHRCTALRCTEYFSVYIDPAVCKGCDICRGKAPDGAILGEKGQIHVVKNDSELKSDEFIAVCPNGAIKKFSGMVKPKVPDAPVPVGSFGAAAGGAGGGRRRRRG